MNLTTFYLFLCIIFAGRGDERWKKRTREKSYIVRVLDESTEIERDMWPYKDFDVDTENEFYSSMHSKLPKHKKHLKRIQSTKLEDNKKKPILDNSLYNVYISYNRLNNISKDVSINLNNLRNVKNSKVHDKIIPKWPKFQDLLLSIGVEYDFKSDRWIKVKGKLQKITNEVVKHVSTEPNHQKHEFKYRTIRINGSKKRKNIIIALTAIR
ncbi:PREDICTED: uncharacterized protein LOC106118996 [Papilio xuthus]|uniref:Uncharacterized protein LOC106118996 n=1 Tax=Papilio xuthus TaxID=66420 RepID=A0AAJ6ZBS1_PAPXU|nr:PREDICTED: uncharacterized protein LOC106118996 [Papilio xuthus]XP_013169263.1 PREDICTED: uncharacterized protein LOC106118996 [Papilio xuthus]